jgi:hypothetical protein
MGKDSVEIHTKYIIYYIVYDIHFSALYSQNWYSISLVLVENIKIKWGKNIGDILCAWKSYTINFKL